MAKKMTKKELVDALTRDALDTVRQEIIQDEEVWIESVIRFGFKGFTKMSLKELQQEYREKMDGEPVR
jgi:hypothetical protein